MGSDTSKLWKKKWIEQGIEVIHLLQINHPEKFSKIKMKVDKVVTKRVPLHNEDGTTTYKNFVDGVRCYWFNDQGEYQTGNFMTTDLVPFRIAVQGFDVIKQWLKRFDKDNG